MGQGVAVGTRVLVKVAVGVADTVGVAVLVRVAVGVGDGAFTWITYAVKSAGLCIGWLVMSMTSVSRMAGAGGENCHCNVPVPPAAAHRVICATRNSPGPQPVGQLPRAPEANARFPG